MTGPVTLVAVADMTPEELFENWFRLTFDAPRNGDEEYVEKVARQAFLAGIAKQKQEDALQKLVDISQELGLYDEPPVPRRLNPVTLAAGKLLKRKR